MPSGAALGAGVIQPGQGRTGQDEPRGTCRLRMGPRRGDRGSCVHLERVGERRCSALQSWLTHVNVEGWSVDTWGCHNGKFARAGTFLLQPSAARIHIFSPTPTTRHFHCRLHASRPGSLCVRPPCAAAGQVQGSDKIKQQRNINKAMFLHGCMLWSGESVHRSIPGPTGTPTADTRRLSLAGAAASMLQLPRPCSSLGF